MFKLPHNTWSAYMFCLLLICRCFSVLSFMDYSMACVIFPLYFPVSDRRHTIPLGYTHCNYPRHPLILLVVQVLLVIVQSTTTSAKSSCQNHTTHPCSTQTRWCCLVLPWQPDQSLDTNNGDHVTQNKTVASTGETHNHDRNFRPSIAGKDYIVNVSSSKWFLRLSSFGTSSQTQQMRRVSWQSWDFCWIVCSSFAATLSQAICLDCLWRKRVQGNEASARPKGIWDRGNFRPFSPPNSSSFLFGLRACSPTTNQTPGTN